MQMDDIIPIAGKEEVECFIQSLKTLDSSQKRDLIEYMKKLEILSKGYSEIDLTDNYLDSK